MENYFVTLKKGVDVDEFSDDMETPGGSLYIPDRSVDVADRRPNNLRSTLYNLSADEAETIRQDSRVVAVQLPVPVSARTDFGTQTGRFYRGTNKDSGVVNWGLRRCIQTSYESSQETFSNNQGFTYNLDGTGVDVVIQDSGVMTGHPEWEDKFGVTRLVEHDWYTAAGVSGTMPVGFYGDVGNHGTHVASTVAGKLYGWAKNARIYSMRYDLMAEDDMYDLIRLWHLSKPITRTGYRRPTIVNASWGYRWYYPGYNAAQGGAITDIQYRGVSRGTSLSVNWGMKVNSSGRVGCLRDAVNDAAAEDCIDAGITVVRAAGNYYHKLDVAGGLDYDNSMTLDTSWASVSAGTPIFYNRPGSPYADGMIMVANINATNTVAGVEPIANSSEKGPRIDVCAPGSQITAATNTAGYGSFYDSTYPTNSNYKISRISGTSMASPQVCGVLAQYLQINPHATPADLKNWVIANAQSGSLDVGTGTGTDYSDDSSLQGGPDRYLYQPFNNPIQGRIRNA